MLSITEFALDPLEGLQAGLDAQEGANQDHHLWPDRLTHPGIEDKCCEDPLHAQPFPSQELQRSGSIQEQPPSQAAGFVQPQTRQVRVESAHRELH